MNILVTGGQGFLGGAILSRLFEKYDLLDNEFYTLSRSKQEYYNHFVCDLKDESRTNVVIEQIQPDVVFHCSSNPSSRVNISNQNELIQDNICGTHNLLRAIGKTKKCPNFVFASSVTVYGDFYERIKISSNDTPNPLSLYSITKLACEHLVHTHHMMEDINGICVRLPAIVGANSTHGLVHDIIRKVNSDSPTLNLIGKAPGSKKPFVEVGEVADLLIESGIDICWAKNITVSNDDNLTVEEVAHLVMDTLGKHKEICWPEDTWAGDQNLINVRSDIKLPSNSRQSIIKAVEEWMKINEN